MKMDMSTLNANRENKHDQNPGSSPESLIDSTIGSTESWTDRHVNMSILNITSPIHRIKDQRKGAEIQDTDIFFKHGIVQVKKNIERVDSFERFGN